MTEILRKMWSNDEGQDIAEYALLLAVVLIVTVAAVTALSNQAKETFSAATSAIKPGS